MLRKRPQIASPLQASFPTHTILHTYSQDHLIIKATIQDILKAPIANWQYNRPADPARCEEIANYIYKTKKPVDTMLYLSLNNKTSQYDVIDGIHRYTALKYIKDNIEEEFDPAKDLVAQQTDWLFNSYMLLSIRLHATDGELIELFQSLNKSNPIPELYVRDTKKDKRDHIERVCHIWQQTYKLHFSSSNKPNKPNINRDRFIDILDQTYDKLHLTEETKDRLEQTLHRTNAHIAQNLPKKLSQTIREKCELTGCWLFIYTPEELVKML